MSEYFEKDVFVHKRGADKKVLPVDVVVTVDEKDMKVSVLPMTEGEINDLTEKQKQIDAFRKSDKPEEKEKAKKMTVENEETLILSHIVNPKFEKEDLGFMKTIPKMQLAKAVMIGSGYERDKIDERFRQLIDAQVKELGGKNPQ